MSDRSTLITAVAVVVAGASVAVAWRTSSTVDDLDARIARLETTSARNSDAPRRRFDDAATARVDDGSNDVGSGFVGSRGRGRAERDVEASPSPSPSPVPSERAADAPVQDIVRRELQRAEDEREQARDARRQQRVVERVQTFATEHQLTAAQQQSMTTMLTAEQQEIRQVMQDARDNDSFDGVRDRVREIRRSTDENVKAVLDDDQMKAFATTREEEAARFRGFGPPPSGPPGADVVDAGAR